MEKQKTITRDISLSGIGLHTANKSTVTFKPAEIDCGINFVRVDLPGRPLIKACVENLVFLPNSPRRTSLVKDGAQVHTVEHLMAALAGAGIDNIYVEMDNNEAPGMDGSSLDFLKAILEAGIKEQDKERRGFAVREPIFIEEDGTSIVAVPAQEFKISYTLSYDHPLLKAQYLSLGINSSSFKAEIAPARTFCLEEEAAELQRAGVGKGANYDNTLVMGRSGVIKNKLRFEDECIRHKILDLIGDLSILGGSLKAHIIALRSGHSLNMKLLQKIDQQMKKMVSSGIQVKYHPQPGEEIDVEAIMKILPHREPFLFVDRILFLEQGKRAVGIKNVTINDYFFRGHFPNKPVMPGVLIVEAMAQVGGVMMLSPEENRGKLAFFMAANNIKFRKTVVPGDQLVFEVVAGRIKSKTGQVFGKAMVDGKVVAEAELMFALADY
jgi:UDP-3-O-[3-hydroxymyristoyl] N-acetylglucosamine deacetylase/3-hydroxyacyl-[acyl-carrier-protein] dehydratase